jgi:hypothetical protein
MKAVSLREASAALMLTMCLTDAVAKSTAGKPNVVLIVADDQGYANIGYHNSTVLTPRIDQLARSGGCRFCVLFQLSVFEF